MEPVVSIIIPAYNSAKYLPSALASIGQQTFQDWEIILVDDGSTDNTRQMVEQQSLPVNYIFQENQGTSAARNRGIETASGEYLVFLDADDTLLPDKLNSQVSAFRMRPNLSILNSAWWFIDGNGTRMSLEEPWHSAPRLDLGTWLFWKPIFPAALMFDTEAVRAAGGFDETLFQAEDVDLVLRMSAVGNQAAWVYQPTACYRKHDGNITLKAADQTNSLARVIDKFYSRTDLPGYIYRKEKEVRYYTDLWSAWHLYHHGQIKEMEVRLASSLHYSHQPPSYLVLEWNCQFTHWLMKQGGETTQLKSIWLNFLKVAAIPPSDQQRLLGALEWWSTVWWGYINGHYDSGAQGLTVLPEIPANDLVELARNAMLCSPSPTSLSAVEHFWADAKNMGRISDADHGKITGLYLTLFAQSIFSRNWAIARSALGKALRSSISVTGSMAWGGFFKRSVGYYWSKLTR